MDELIPRDVLFGEPDRTGVTLSPDGRHLAFLAPVDGAPQVFVMPAEGAEEPRRLTHHGGAGVRDYQWSAQSEAIVFVTDVDGDENWQLRLVRVDDGEETVLVAEPGVQARLYPPSRHHEDRILVALNDRDPRLHDLVMLSFDGSRERVFENDRFLAVHVDWAYQPTWAVEPRPDGGSNIYLRDGDGWRLESEIAQPEELTTGVGPCTADGQTWYWLDSRGRDTASLVAVSLDGSRDVVASFEGADVDGLSTHPETGVAQLATATRVERAYLVLDPAIEEPLTRLRAHRPGELSIVSRSNDDARWVVQWSLDDGPATWALYETASGTITDLFVDRAALVGQPLRPREGLEIPTRDGMSMVSYLTRPSGEGPHPMVLFVHGGPWARDQPGFSPYHQLLANRGYAVLSPNFRGSTGFGKAFVNAGDRQWGGKMHDDLLDAVQWAVEQGITTRDQVAIMGGSYGGYATLVGLTFTPEVFACGVDIVGPSSLVTLIETIPPYWGPLKGTFTSRVGDVDTAEGRAQLWARSPLSKVHDVVRPLLIAQGANDPRVKQAESEQIVGALRERDIPVQYALFPDEGHGFTREVNRLAFIALTEAFLAEHLGGRAEPAGETLDASSLILS